MKRFLFLYSLAAAILLASSGPGWAQPDHDVAHWLNRDISMLINIRDVATTYEKIKSLDLFSNPRFIKALAMLSDERFPIIDEECAEQVKSRLFELESLLRNIKQISFAVHDLDADQFHWSLFIRADADVLDKIQSGMLGIEQQLRIPDPAKVDEQPKPELDDSVSSSDAPGSEDVGWGKIRRVNEWLILSNQSAFLDRLADRIGDKSFRSLGQSRKYRAINKRKSPLDDREGLITIYGNPVRLRYFFPNTTQTEWEMSEMDELPACGLNIVFADSAIDDASSQPILLADAVVKFTRPAVGKAKVYEFYRSVEVPPLAVEPVEFLAFARDEVAVFDEMSKRYKAHHDLGSADTGWGDRVKEIGLENRDDAVPRREAYYEMRFIDQKQTVDRPGLMTLEKLRDMAAARRFVNGVTRFANDNHQQMLTNQEEGAIFWWTIPQEKFDLNSGLDGFDRTRNSDPDFFNCKHDAYVLTDEWWVQGEMPAVKNQVNLLTSGEAEDHGQSLRTLVDDLKRRLGGEEQTFIIQYFTTDSWQENLNNLEQQYANANAQPIELKLKVIDEKSGRLFLGLGQDSQISDGIIGGSFEIQLDGIQLDSTDGNEGQSPRLSLSSLQSIQLMMPLRLAERNEDGHRIDLKRREDLETAIRVMILKSISESFPRQLFLYTRTDEHIRIMLGVYPNVDRAVSE